MNNADVQAYTLLEVLVAMLVLSIGLLGLAGLQAHGLKANHEAFLRSQAVYLSADMLDRMTANRADALAGWYDFEEGEYPPGVSGRSMADIEQWLASLSALPEGQGTVEVRDGVASVIVRWEDPKAPEESTEYRVDARL
jgi:type IV pilus assembly protein PilV